MYDCTDSRKVASMAKGGEGKEGTLNENVDEYDLYNTYNTLVVETNDFVQVSPLAKQTQAGRLQDTDGKVGTHSGIRHFQNPMNPSPKLLPKASSASQSAPETDFLEKTLQKKPLQP